MKINRKFLIVFLMLVIGYEKCHSSEIKDYNEFFKYSLSINAISSDYEKLIHPYLETVADLSDDDRKININKGPCSSCINVLLLDMDKFLDNKNEKKILGMIYEEFVLSMKRNILAAPPNLLLIDSNYIGEIIFNAFNLTLNIHQSTDLSIGNGDLHEINDLTQQVGYLGIGNTKAFIEGTDLSKRLLDISKKLSNSYLVLDEEIDPYKSIIMKLPTNSPKSGFLDDLDISDRINIWNFTMYNLLKKGKEKLPELLTSSFILLFSHELAHLNKNNTYKYNFLSISDLLEYWVNRNVRKEEDRADTAALKNLQKYINKISNDKEISDTSKLVRAFTGLSTINTLYNDVLVNNFSGMRGLYAQDLLFKILVRDCRKNKSTKHLDHWNTNRAIDISYDRVPFMSRSEIKKIRDKYNSESFKSTHSHHIDRIADYYKIILNSPIIKKSWVNEKFPFKGNILKLWNKDERLIRSMINPDDYSSTLRIKKDELFSISSVIDTEWEEAENCPIGQCYIGTVKDGDTMEEVDGYFEVITEDNNVKSIKIVYNLGVMTEKSLKFRMVVIAIIVKSSIIEIEAKEALDVIMDFYDQLDECKWATKFHHFNLYRSVDFNTVSVELGLPDKPSLLNVSKLENNKYIDDTIYSGIKKLFDEYAIKGMFGMEEIVEKCYGRVNSETDISLMQKCYSMDLSANSWDSTFVDTMNLPPYAYFLKDKIYSRLERAFSRKGVLSESSRNYLVDKWTTIAVKNQNKYFQDRNKGLIDICHDINGCAAQETDGLQVD